MSTVGFYPDGAREGVLKSALSSGIQSAILCGMNGSAALTRPLVERVPRFLGRFGTTGQERADGP